MQGHGVEMGDRIGEEEVREALRSGLPWTDPVCLAVTDSTNRVAMEMAGSPLPQATSRTRMPGSMCASATIASVTSRPSAADGTRQRWLACTRAKLFQFASFIRTAL